MNLKLKSILAGHRSAVFRIFQKFDENGESGTELVDSDELSKQKSNINDKDKLFCFGGGPRCCVGQKLVWCIIDTIIDEMLTKFKVSLIDEQDLTHKWLPVSRPKNEVLVQFTEKDKSQ
ncbi:Hypothetical predicted protein [Mytilus galloprovincialis]|uniref:Uncharacterized protein n=1 Tax=Mytilus galloprovincialis TaxID=29158 RepID=A0A8B6BH36_MYTGA|nr:Hypothetical predicted protein [Mytilus galloprovincialis]